MGVDLGLVLGLSMLVFLANVIWSLLLRRELAEATFQMHRRDVLVGEHRRVAALTDGTAEIGGENHHWSTVGLYELDDRDRIAACWLLALDQRSFDASWSR